MSGFPYKNNIDELIKRLENTIKVKSGDTYKMVADLDESIKEFKDAVKELNFNKPEVSSNFKKGDQVYLKLGNYPLSSHNPINTVGTIIEVNRGAITELVGVSWNNGFTSYYYKNDLIPANTSENKINSIW